MSIENYIASRWEDQLFHLKSKSLQSLNKKLGLTNRKTIADNYKQIVQELIDKYGYMGVYDSNYISAFIDIWTAAFFGEDEVGNNTLEGIIAQIKLDDLLLYEYVDEFYKDNVPQFFMTEEQYNQLRNKEYLADVELRANDIKQRRDKIIKERNIGEKHYVPESSNEGLYPELQLYESFNDASSIIPNIDVKESEILDIHNQFLPTNKDMTNRTKIPLYSMGVEALDQLRDSSIKRLSDNGFETRDLDESLTNMANYNALAGNLHRQRRKKENKLGLSGMDELVKIVAGLKQDVKQIRDAQSLQSANDWINRHGYNDLYEALHEDVDGDGIDDVVVRTKEGKNRVIVNGFTTVPSTYPYRRFHYERYPTRAERKGKTVRQTINDLYSPIYDKWGRKITDYGNKKMVKEFRDKYFAPENGWKKTIEPSSRSSYQAFVCRCITPFYTAIKYFANGSKLPFTIAQLASAIWNQFVLVPAMGHVYGNNIGNVSPEQWKSLRSKAPVKRAIDFIIKDYLRIPSTMFGDIYPTIIELCRASGIPISDEYADHIGYATCCIIARVPLPPNPADFPAFRAANEKTGHTIESFMIEGPPPEDKVVEVFDEQAQTA